MSKYGDDYANVLYKKFRKVNKTRSVVVTQPNDIWGVDLIELPVSIKRNKYVLNVIDIFTKKAFSLPLTNKKAAAWKKGLNEAFEFFKSKPNKIWSDEDSSLLSLTKWLGSEGITIYHTYGKVHNPITERFNGIQKENVQKYMVNKDLEEWEEPIQKFNDVYNNTTHGMTGFKPNEATEHVEEIKDKFIKKSMKPRKDKVKFKVGDRVRIAAKHGTFVKKSVAQAWSDEIFIISEVR